MMHAFDRTDLTRGLLLCVALAYYIFFGSLSASEKLSDYFFGAGTRAISFVFIFVIAAYRQLGRR